MTAIMNIPATLLMGEKSEVAQAIIIPCFVLFICVGSQLPGLWINIHEGWKFGRSAAQTVHRMTYPLRWRWALLCALVSVWISGCQSTPYYSESPPRRMTSDQDGKPWYDATGFHR